MVREVSAILVATSTLRRSERAMTARPASLGEDCAAEITEALLAFDPVGAVAIDLTTKPPATIEWE